MTKFVRVTAENGYHVTISEAHAKAEGLRPLKEAPCDRHGRPLPEAPGKKAAAAESAQTPAEPAETPSGSGDAASTQEENQ